MINQNECWRLIWCIFLKNDIYEVSHFSSTPVCYPWHFSALSHWILFICFANNFENEQSFGPFCSTTCDWTNYSRSCPCCLKLSPKFKIKSNDFWRATLQKKSYFVKSHCIFEVGNEMDFTWWILYTKLKKYRALMKQIKMNVVLDTKVNNIDNNWNELL